MLKYIIKSIIGMKNLSQKEWAEMAASDPNAVILDVRTTEECMDGIIENAVCIDFFQKEKLMAEIDKMDKNKNYFVYCRSGRRSGMVCEMLKDKGFKNTYNLDGGIMQWKGKLV